MVVAAASDRAASGLHRGTKIDLTKTPYLNWSWKVTAIFPDINENLKSGYGFPARICVVVKRGPLGIRYIALNYVWASQHRLGSVWPSPIRILRLTVESGPTGLGSWVRHKRNLEQDLESVLGEEITQIDAAALMTDTDDHPDPLRRHPVPSTVKPLCLDFALVRPRQLAAGAERSGARPYSAGKSVSVIVMIFSSAITAV
jgi:hypothetical protein